MKKQVRLREMIQNLGFVFGQGCAGMMEALGMQAANMERYQNKQPIKYLEDDFARLIQEKGLDHQSLMAKIYGGVI
uniref:Uncharacterized protein n=1 Tax=viral metagenome TaxID=1070528 RepID=A0A6M3KGI6_9ZZZZ